MTRDKIRIQIKPSQKYSSDDFSVSTFSVTNTNKEINIVNSSMNVTIKFVPTYKLRDYLNVMDNYSI